MSFGDVLLTGLMLVSLFLMFVILLQRGRGGGLAGAFGGLGGQSAFGTKAGDVFTVITVVTVIIWVILACIAGARLRYENSPEFRFKNEVVEPPRAGADDPVRQTTGDGNEGQDDTNGGSSDSEKKKSGAKKKDPTSKAAGKVDAPPELDPESSGADKGQTKARPEAGAKNPDGDDTSEKEQPDKN